MITEYRQYLDPKKVWIPLTDGTFKLASVQVEQDDAVTAGQIVAYKYSGKLKTPVLASITGTVIGFEERLDRFNKYVDHIVIERSDSNQMITHEGLDGDVPAAIIRQRIEDCGLRQFNVDGLYTDIAFERPIKHILVNAIYANEPFISTDYDFVKQHAELIADGIKLLQHAAHAETATLIVDKYMDEQTLEALGKATVDKGIEVVQVNTKHVNGWDYRIAKQLVGETISPNLIDNQILYTSAYAAKHIHDAVRNGRPLIERQVAITGDALRVNVLYDVRLGTRLEDLVDDLGGYDDGGTYMCHVGSFLSGEQVAADSFSVTATVDTIDVSAYRQEPEEVCIKCGECNDICPAGILPQNIMDAELRNVNARIVDLHTDECIECGLCSYVCPSKINVLEWVRRAKRRVG